MSRPRTIPPAPARAHRACSRCRSRRSSRRRTPAAWSSAHSPTFSPRPKRAWRGRGRRCRRWRSLWRAFRLRCPRRRQAGRSWGYIRCAKRSRDRKRRPHSRRSRPAGRGCRTPAWAPSPSWHRYRKCSRGRSRPFLRSPRSTCRPSSFRCPWGRRSAP